MLILALQSHQHLSSPLYVLILSVSEGLLLTHKDQATVIGFKSRTISVLEGTHCVSYYAKITGNGTGHVKTSLTEAASGKVISDKEHIADISESKPKLVYFDVPEQKNPYQVGYSRDGIRRSRWRVVAIIVQVYINVENEFISFLVYSL